MGDIIKLGIMLPTDCTGKLNVMAKQVRPWLTKPDTNHERKVRPSDEASTSEFHQGQRNEPSSLEGRMYGCNLYLPPTTERLAWQTGERPCMVRRLIPLS